METKITDVTIDVVKEKIVNQLELLLKVYRDTTEDVNLPTGVNLQEEIERDKARLVAKGFTLKEDIDYTDTFFPLSKKDSLRII
ncbi:hypothetical protein RJ639_024872 [Escallonia herrerae]|nr:hypothetical protein RJ639_029496 [Escallonia herrerae]KAK2996384.1 hypothetical protein RJ639_026315 [Escallonia herrerae]KAK2996596.1 hypothetical protein RJ639_024872 [Escallonia herrerae]